MTDIDPRAEAIAITLDGLSRILTGVQDGVEGRAADSRDYKRGFTDAMALAIETLRESATKFREP